MVAPITSGTDAILLLTGMRPGNTKRIDAGRSFRNGPDQGRHRKRAVGAPTTRNGSAKPIRTFNLGCRDILDPNEAEIGRVIVEMTDGRSSRT